jgi:hypothetical protein
VNEHVELVTMSFIVISFIPIAIELVKAWRERRASK